MVCKDKEIKWAIVISKRNLVMNRKIELPEYLCPYPYTKGGDSDCDHDYPPESKRESDNGADWTCSKCGMVTSFDVWD